MFRLALASTLVWCFVETTVGQDKYAVVVGVDTYDTSNFQNLEFACRDAERLGAALDDLDFATTVMTKRSDNSRLHPSTPRKIANIIKTVVASCGKGDTLLISLSGHGIQFMDEELLPTGVRETYFCPSDADLSDKSSLLKVSDMVKFMNRSAASRKFLLVDACRESVLSQNGRRKSAKRIELGSVFENGVSIPGGMAVLFSCSSNQFSWEHAPLEHSVFSYHVIKYLKGEADSRFYDDGDIDLSGLVFYVSKRTNDYVFGENLDRGGQSPVLRGNSANWSFGKLKTTKAAEELLRRVEALRKNEESRLRKEVQTQLDAAVKISRGDPVRVTGALKSLLAQVQSTPDLGPDLRKELIGKIEDQIEKSSQIESDFVRSKRQGSGPGSSPEYVGGLF